MDEYISREAAIAYIREQSEECQKAFEELGGESGIYADAYNDLAEDFYSIPAADVAPVVHGQWGKDNRCSICHHEAIYTVENIRPEYDWTFVDGGDEEETPTGEVLYDKVYVKSRFCPACGVKMLNAEEE